VSCACSVLPEYWLRRHSEEARPTDPNHPLTTLLKRKLGLLNPESDGQTPKKAKADDSNGGLDPNLTEEDRELLEGLKRFKGSKLGHEVGEICVNQ